MPVNSDGVEVNEDGSEITPEQQETSDWTQVVELNQSNKIKPLSIDVLAPSVVPHNIPYLEVYRTDELYAKDYVSPFMNAPSSSDTEGENNENGEDEGSNTENNNNSSHDTPHSSKTKNQKLASEMGDILSKYYKSTSNLDTLVDRYMGCRSNKKSINEVTEKSSKNLRDNANTTSLANEILKVKNKYS